MDIFVHQNNDQAHTTEFQKIEISPAQSYTVSCSCDIISVSTSLLSTVSVLEHNLTANHAAKIGKYM